MRRLLSKDPLTKKATYYVSDGEKFRFETIQDVEGLIEDSKASFNNTDERARWGEMTKIASIPLVIYDDLQRRGIADDAKKFKAWLNDSSNRVFRTRPGRV